MSALAMALVRLADAAFMLLAAPKVGFTRTHRATVQPLDELAEFLTPGSEVVRKHTPRGLTLFGFESIHDGACLLVCCHGRPVELWIGCNEMGLGGRPCPDEQTPAGSLEGLLDLLSAYFE